MKPRNWLFLLAYVLASCAAPGLHDHGAVRLGGAFTKQGTADSASSHKDAPSSNDLARHVDDCAACQLQIDLQVDSPPHAIGLTLSLDVATIAGPEPTDVQPRRLQPSRAPPLA